MKNLIKCSVLITLIISSLGVPKINAQQDVIVTITNQNRALVREVRNFDLKKGQQEINVHNIPEQLIPSSVIIENADQSFRVIEQNFEYDLLNLNRLIDKSINTTIEVIHPEMGLISGKLLAGNASHLILLDETGQLQMVPRNDEQKIIFSDLEKTVGAFVTKPTLVWKVNARRNGNHTTRLSYLTNGLNWQADYIGRLHEEDKQIEFDCWVTINNNSGHTFRNTQLKLMAGDLNRVSKGRDGITEIASRTKLAQAGLESKNFAQKNLFEYHLYALDRRTTLEDRQVKQIQLFKGKSSPVQKKYHVNSRNSETVAVMISFKNEARGGLGMPLPQGKVRLYKKVNGDMEFIGEDAISPTPEDEEVQILIGTAFDVISERTVTDVKRPAKRTEESTIVYELRNRKDENIEVEVLEYLNQYQQNKIITSNYQPFEVQASHVKFRVPVEANGENQLRFTLSRNW
ncbi:MAG: DUF4139 domain-containing protein [Caldithrix sp.]|nr:DUF4139 domain-containing protein [Caldithrix sp.]